MLLQARLESMILKNDFMNPPFSQTRLQALLESMILESNFMSPPFSQTLVQEHLKSMISLFQKETLETQHASPGTVGIYDFGNRLYEPALFPNSRPGTFKIYNFIISERDFRNPTCFSMHGWNL